MNYLIPFLAVFWMYATPVIYPASLIPDKWRLVLALNPMAGVIEGFRWALLGKGDPPGAMLAVTVSVVLVVLVSGALVFRKMERNFADLI